MQLPALAGHAAASMLSAWSEHWHLELGKPVTAQQVLMLLRASLLARLCQDGLQHSAHVLICKPAVVGLHTMYSVLKLQDHVLG